MKLTKITFLALLLAFNFANAQIQLIREKRVQSFLAKTMSPNDIYDRSIITQIGIVFRRRSFMRGPVCKN